MGPGQVPKLPTHVNNFNAMYLNQYVIVRTINAGVFAGFVKEFDKSNAMVILNSSRRLWYWSGAASLSELAVKGISNPSQCKFPVAMPEQLILGVIEILPCSEKAQKSIEEVKEWSAH